MKRKKERKKERNRERKKELTEKPHWHPCGSSSWSLTFVGFFFHRFDSPENKNKKISNKIHNF